MSFRFANHFAFQLMWFLPLFLILSIYFFKRSQKTLAAAFGTRLSKFLASSVSMPKRKWKLTLEIVALTLFILALARPQAGESRQKIKSEGVEMIILFDVSNSMLAEDVKPSRLELAKAELNRFLDRGGGDKVGLIAFAGSAAILSPLTTDKAALKMYIDSLAPNSVSSQGTEFRKALLEARDAFKRGGDDDEEESGVARVALLVSDGEDNEPGALAAARDLTKDGIHIFALGIGSEKGGAIPVRDDHGNLRGYHKDASGQVVMSQTKGTVLKQIAQAGNGNYYQITYGGNAILSLRSDLEKMQKAEFANAEITNYDERYQIILLFAITVLTIELVLGERRGRGRIWRGRFEVEEA